MNKIRGIIFDKDGTLLDFNSIWLPAAMLLAENAAAKYGSIELKVQLLESIGVKAGKVETSGILASGTVLDIVNAFYRVFNLNSISVSYLELENTIPEMISKFVEDNIFSITPTGRLTALFDKLKSENIIIGLATSDTMKSTIHCLERLEVLHYFDFIRTGDIGSSPKPDPAVMYEFCERYGLKTEEVAVVGDTIVDMEFGKNGKAGVTIGVLSGVGKEYELSKLADFLYENVNGILQNDRLFLKAEN